MTESSVAVPTTTTTQLATDEVDGRHYQEVKLRDGREGSENRWGINADGSGFVSSRVMFHAFVFSDIAQPSYDAGELVGSVTSSTNAPIGQGAYRLLAVFAADLTGAPLAPGLRIVLFGSDPVDDVVSKADGDTLTPAGFTGSATAAVLFDGDTVAAGVGKHPLFPEASAVLNDPGRSWVCLDGSAPFDGSHVRPHAALVAEDAIASPSSGPIAVTVAVDVYGTDQIESFES